MGKQGKPIVCEICGCGDYTTMNFRYHLKKHQCVDNSKDYYDKYIKHDDEGYCLECGKETTFKNILDGYCDYCCKTCAQSSTRVKCLVKNGFMKKYGGYFNNREKAKQTCNMKYGCDNVSQIDDVKEKKEHAFKEKYGVSSFVQTEEHRLNMECRHGWIPKENKDDYELYSIECWKETNSHIIRLFSEWNGLDYYDGQELLTDKREYNNPMYRTIDHKISIKFGFDNNISPSEIGGFDNLCICSRKHNSSKKHLTEKEYIDLW